MSLHQLAKHVQDKGRGEDTQLVHMTPKEVEGLQALAVKHGGSLTINPHTGLPEAGFLSSILPTVVGAGVGIMTANPMIGAAVGGGLGMAMNGGSLRSGIMSGIGAYGMGSLGAGMMGAGEAALASSPEAVAGALGVEGAATGAGSQAAMLAQQNAGMGIEGLNSIKSAAATAEGFNPAAVTAASSTSPWDVATKGYQATKFDTDYLKKNAVPIGAAGLGLLGASGMLDQKQSTMPGVSTTPSYIRPYKYSQTTNPNFGQPGQPYFTQSYTAQPVVDASQWGTRTFADGGIAALGSGNSMFPQSQQEHTNFATPTQMPTSAEIIASDYDTRTNPYTGQEPVRMATGGVSQDVLDYNNAIAAQAKKEYVDTPPPANMMPGGGVAPKPAAAPAAAAPAATPSLVMPSAFSQSDLGIPSIDLNSLIAQYQAGNPNARTYNAATQTYGTVQPTQAQLDIFAQQYIDTHRPYVSPYKVDTGIGGGANGGLMPESLKYAQGGLSSLGGYSDGGQLLRGPGDGVSDSIPAQIGAKQPARLADGEFVVPARIVSELGNGSTEAGAKRLYAMMDRVQHARKKSIGKNKVAVNSRADKLLPA